MGRTRALRNVKEVELENIPNLTKCGLMTSFKCVESVKMENVSKLGEVKALKEAVEKRKAEERKRKEAEEAAAISSREVCIRCKMDWDRMDKRIGRIEVGDNSCNEVGFKTLDLSGFVNLKVFIVEDECFMFVDEVRIIGLNKLDRIRIGKKCFTKWKDSCPNYYSNRQFHLKDCPSLRELIIGYYSFSDYSVCEIENVDALKSIEMGDMNGISGSFAYASLELIGVSFSRE